jgi:hypothetical protein
LEKEVAGFYDNLNESLTSCIPKATVSKRETLMWLTRECTDARAHLKSLQTDSYERHKDVLEELKLARYDYKAMIKPERLLSVRKLVSETDNVQSISKLSKILTKRNVDERLGLLTRPDGYVCQNTPDNLQTLLREYFPGSREVSEPPLPKESHMEVVINPWITADRIREAISGFGPNKTPGPDGIKPLVLQHLSEKALDKLVKKINASMSLGYTPAIWKRSKVVFIPKSGKKDYGDPRSFWPISLTCFLFMTLERLFMWQLDESCLMDKPLHDNQFAFQKGRSTEHALSKTVNYIEQELNSAETRCN